MLILLLSTGIYRCKFHPNLNNFLSWKLCILNCCLQIISYFVQASICKRVCCEVDSHDLEIKWHDIDVMASNDIVIWGYEYQVPLSRLLLKVDNSSMAFAQDCSNSIANTLDLLQSCAKPLNWTRIMQIFNTLAPGRFEWNFRHVIFKQILVIDGWGISCEINCPDMNVTGHHWWPVSIGSGNGLVPSGNTPLPEPMLTRIYVTKLHH